MGKPADLAKHNVKRPQALAIASTNAKPQAEMVNKGFRITKDAAHQFEMLKAELGRDSPKDTGPRLIAEALNDLFRKYGKQPIA